MNIKLNYIVHVLKRVAIALIVSGIVSIIFELFGVERSGRTMLIYPTVAIAIYEGLDGQFLRNRAKLNLFKVVIAQYAGMHIVEPNAKISTHLIFFAVMIVYLLVREQIARTPINEELIVIKRAAFLHRSKEYHEDGLEQLKAILVRAFESGVSHEEMVKIEAQIDEFTTQVDYLKKDLRKTELKLRTQKFEFEDLRENLF